MPKHKLFHSGEDEEIPTPISRKRPNETSSRSVFNKVKKRAVNEKLNKQGSVIQNGSHFEAVTDDEEPDIQILEEEIKKKKSSERKPSSLWASNKIQDSDSDSDSEVDLRPKSKPRSTSLKLQYSKHEDKKIIEYVMQYDRINKTCSINLWKRLENADENVNKRTYQSLKNRFLKQIVPKLLTDYIRLLDERNIKMVVAKFPHAKNGMKKHQYEKLLEKAKNRGTVTTPLKFYQQNDGSREGEKNTKEVLKYRKNATSTPLNDIKNRNDVGLKQDNNSILSEFFNDSGSSRKEVVDRRKKTVVEEVVQIEETSDEESDVIKNTPDEVLAENRAKQLQNKENEKYSVEIVENKETQVRNRENKICSVDIMDEEEEETQLQDEPCNFNVVLQLSNSENVVPVIVDTQTKLLDSSPSQSLLFRDVNKISVQNENDLKVPEKQMKVEKPIFRRKKASYKLFHYSLKQRREIMQVVKLILKVRKRNRIKAKRRKMLFAKQKKKDNIKVQEMREEEKLEEGEIEDEENEKKNEDEPGKSEEEEREYNKEGKSEQEIVAREKNEYKVVKVKEEPEAEMDKEIHIVKITESNMLDYYTKKALAQYEQLISDTESESELSDIKKFTDEIQKYSKLLVMPKREIISSEDEESGHVQQVDTTSKISSSSFETSDLVNFPEKTSKKVEKLNNSSGLLSNMLGMLSEKERKKV